jgi:pSer/pThr/pTyr-binding forkhead associated (FHA) protein
MARLVVLSEGFTGLSHELQAEKTSIGRVPEDNTFTIAEPSVSSHHCEILKKGEEFHVKDLGSTNGTFINGDQVTQAALKPGQILRLGQVELRLETGAAGPAKKPLDKTMVLPQGVKVTDFEKGKPTPVDAMGGFAKKSNDTKIWLWVGIGLGVVIVVILALAFFKMIAG